MEIIVINRTGLDLDGTQAYPDWREICDDLEPYVEPFTREDRMAFQAAFWIFFTLDSIAVIAGIGLLVRWMIMKLL
jgi:hypothetical protein